jgi:ubiquitin carboxyl-terminal hydrolase 8
VRKIGGETETTYDTSKGAELEFTEADDSTTNGNKRPLLVLNRTQKILMESPQENFNSVSTLSPKDAKREYTAQPPYIRWVNLYGEEICAMGTHHKMESTKFGPATLRYQFDQSRGPPVEIMKTFNNIHGAGFIRESLRGIPPSPGAVGLHNLGNSCFMNSIVQCLNHTQPLTQYFLRGTYVTEINRKNPLGSGGRVSTAYGSLLNEIWSGEFSALAPRLLKQTVGSFAPQFNNVYQHDSHEFCSFLMDGIHEDLNRVVTKPYVEELEGFGMPDEKAAIESWKNHLLRHDSIIVDHFQGMHRSHLTCPICGRESIKFDVYSSLSLHLGYEKGRSSIPLEECLEKFSEGEQLDEHNAWYCPTCKKHVCALKMIALWTVPDILILHLKRFTFNHCTTSGSVVRNKVEDKVIFPIERLNMRPYILGPIDEEAPPVYRVSFMPQHVATESVPTLFPYNCLRVISCSYLG